MIPLIKRAVAWTFNLIERVSVAIARDWVRSLVFALIVALMVLPPAMRALLVRIAHGFLAWEAHCAPSWKPSWSEAPLCALEGAPMVGAFFRVAFRMLPPIALSYLIYCFALAFSGWSVRTVRAQPGHLRRARATRVARRNDVRR